VEGIKRPHLGGQAWRDLLQRFNASGISVGEFCKRERLNKSTFQRWRARLTAAPSGPASAAAPEGSGEQAPTSFIDLGSLGATSAAVTARLDLKLDLGGGLTLHLVRG
jgi:putative transposase